MRGGPAAATSIEQRAFLLFDCPIKYVYKATLKAPARYVVIAVRFYALQVAARANLWDLKFELSHVYMYFLLGKIARSVCI